MKPQQTVLRVTPGGICYRFTPKAVKNYNLRLGKDGTPQVSAPYKATPSSVDAFVDQHAQWLAKARAHAAVQAQRDALPLPDPAQALAAFIAMSDQVFPAFAQVLGGQKPVVRVRDMSSRWGVCHLQKRQLTFALRLYQMPPAAQIYVVVHEYCHFIEPNHSPAFWAQVARILPDWKARRALLRNQ